MNEKTCRLQWNDLDLFLAVAREGGLSPAARATGRSAATLGRRMRALERALGRELLIRHDRGYELTTDGRAFLEELSAIGSKIDHLTRVRTRAARPLVKVSAGTWTTLQLLHRFDDLVGDPPDVRLRFISAEHRFDIRHREIVIGLRNQRPTEESLAGRKIARVEFASYARPDASDRWIKVLADTPSSRWLDKMVGDDALCEVTSPRNSLDLAVSGLGIALLPTFIGDRQESLVRVGPVVSELSHDQWIVTHQDDRYLPEVRRTIDRLCAAMENHVGDASLSGQN